MSEIKKRRVSKKNKISWRKNVNINDVEEYLEEVRHEERMGKPLSIISNNDLFNIDTNEKQILSKKEKRKLILGTLPKCFLMLQPHTKVPDPLVKRNRVRTKEERKDPILKKKEEHRKLNGILKVKEKQSLDDKKLYEKKRNITKPDKFSTDIWDINENIEKVDLKSDNWISTQTNIHSLAGNGKVHKTLTKGIRPYKVDKVIPSVELPHPGTSYNPSFKDHQDLLKDIAEKELKIIKEETHLNRVTANMFKKVPVAIRDNQWIVEMSQGLPAISETNNDEADEDESSILHSNQVVRKKKTLQQKRKQKEQLLIRAAIKKTKMEKKKIADIHKLKLLQKTIEFKQIKTNKLKEKKEKVKEYKKKEAKRLGPIKYENPDIEFNMGSEISGNLLLMKKEGNLLADRFKSLQKRSILAPSIKTKLKKPKIKKYTKPGHKEDWKNTIAGFNKNSKL